MNDKRALSEILEYMSMDGDKLQKVLTEADPPLAAVRAATILDFMESYHLTESEDAVKQYSRLRAAQADLLGLTGDSRERFLEGFPSSDEKTSKSTS